MIGVIILLIVLFCIVRFITTSSGRYIGKAAMDKEIRDALLIKDFKMRSIKIRDIIERKNAERTKLGNK